MAVTLQRKFLYVDFVDTSGGMTSRRIEMHTDIADEPAAAAAMIAILQGLTTAVISGYRITHEYAEDTTFGYPADAQNEENAVLTLQLDVNQNKSATFAIPAPKPGSTSGIFQANSGEMADYVNWAHTGIADLRAAFMSTGNFYISDGESIDVSGNGSGRRVHRRSRKRSSLRVG